MRIGGAQRRQISMSKNRKKIENIRCEKVSEKSVGGMVFEPGRRRAQRPGGLGGTVIRQGVWNALHRFDAADLKRFAYAAVPVIIGLTLTPW